MPNESTAGQRSPFAVLFDMDGVIVLSNPAHLAAWQAYGREKLGVDITAEMFFSTISGRKNEDFLPELLPGRFSPEQIVQIAAEKEAFFRTRFGPQLQAVPGVIPLIHELMAHSHSGEVKIAMVTSAPVENVAFVLERFNLASAFSTRVTSAEVAQSKPDPAIYLLGAERVQIPPDRCIVLEDATAGVLSAKRAGMRCLAVATSEPVQCLAAAGADAVCADFREVSFERLRHMAGCK